MMKTMMMKTIKTMMSKLWTALCRRPSCDEDDVVAEIVRIEFEDR